MVDPKHQKFPSVHFTAFMRDKWMKKFGRNKRIKKRD